MAHFCPSTHVPAAAAFPLLASLESTLEQCEDEPHHEKTNNLHMRKQRRRSASR